MEHQHEAETYLRNQNNPTTLYVRIEGRRRRLFINRDTGTIGIIAIGKRKRGHIFTSWNTIEKVFYPNMGDEGMHEKNLVLKYKRLAARASFTNSWLDDIAKAELSKSLYENHLTTGNCIDGKCIRLATIEKYCGSSCIDLFKTALKEGKHYSTPRFDFFGYDGSLWCEPRKDGGVMAGFNKEYRNCGNGYYYLLINDDTFIGYDVD